MEYLLFLVASAFGGTLAWRALRETDLLLILAQAPLLGAAALVALSNARVPPSTSLAALLIFGAVLAGIPGRVAPEWRPMSAWQKGGLAFAALVVLIYTLYHQVHVLDGDRWLHDAQIVAFHRGIYPPVNPLFPELAMNGHFGRDLLMATLTRDGVDPAYTTWWVTPFLQLATFLTLFASTRSFTNSNGRGMLVACFVFFGMDCGFRVGLIDTFDGSNGLAYPHLVLLFHLMNRILKGAPWPVWLVSGVVLGTYQLVYMTSFALLLVTGFVLFLVKARSKQAWIGLLVTGILAMTLALTEGGAFTDMAQRGLKPELNKAVQNQGLRVTVSFPKDHLFQVLTSTAGYHRTSVAYQTSLFEGLYEPPRGEGYMYIWDPQFMRTHWLPLYLAPLSLWLLRASALGMSFWLFGAISYLMPGLFYFGPIFEHEYFRWEFSAAFGFAAALGLALGDWLERRPITFERAPVASLKFEKGTARYLLALAIVVSSLVAGEKAVNDAFIASGKDNFKWFPSLRQWRLSEPTFGMTEDTLKACQWLRERTLPGQQVMTNFLNDRPIGLWPDVVAATLAGVFPAGHAYPSETEGGPHGNPAFHQNSVYRAFWASADLSLLEGTKVQWLLADVTKLAPEVLSRLEKLPHQRFGDRWVVEIPTTEPVTGGTWSLLVPPSPLEHGDLRLGSRYPLMVSFVNLGKEETRAVLTLDGGMVDPLRFTVPAGGQPVELSLVTPLDEGTYQAKLSDLAGEEKLTFSFTVDFLKRLEELTCEISFPQLKAGRFYLLKGEWRSAAPILSEGELELAYRFRRPDGDYAWEVDLIPQPLDLRLPEKPELEVQVLTPTLPGPYELELWFLDRGSGRRVKMKTSMPVAVES